MKRLISLILLGTILLLCLSACTDKTADCEHLWVKETHDKYRCTQTTKVTRTCEYCGLKEQLSETPAKGHRLSDDGTKCEVCGKKADKNCKHDSCVWNQTREMTCTINGERLKICTDCGFFLEAEMIRASGHTEIKYEEKAPTCTEGGNYSCFECTVCGYSNVEYMQREPLGHSYADGVCTRCSAKE